MAGEYYLEPKVMARYRSSAAGDVVGIGDDGFPIHAAYASAMEQGSVLGFSKDGFPIRAADVMGGYHFRNSTLTDQVACGGSSLIFIAVGLGLGWLVADKFVEYSKTKR